MNFFLNIHKIFLCTLFNIYFATSYIFESENFWTAQETLNNAIDLIAGPRTSLYTVNAQYGDVEVDEKWNEFEMTNPYMLYKFGKDNHQRILFPEILAITDDGLYQQFGEKALKNYVVNFLNGISKHFRQIDDPRIVLSLSGLVMSKHPNAIKFIEPSHIYENGSDSGLDTENSLKKMQKWLSESKIIKSNYDFFIILSSWSLNRRNNEGTIQRTNAASTGRVCYIDTSGIIVEVGNDFSTTSAAHEIGHLLGAKHDTHYPCSFMMSDCPSVDTKNNFWSGLSIPSFVDAYNKQSLTCIKNKPAILN